MSSTRVPLPEGINTHTQSTHTHSHTDVHSPRPSEQTHAGRVAHGKIIITPPSLPPLKKTTVCLENSRLLCLRSSRAEAKLHASPIVTKQRHKTVQVCVPVLETLMSERCGVFQLRRQMTVSQMFRGFLSIPEDHVRLLPRNRGWGAVMIGNVSVSTAVRASTSARHTP